MDPEKLECFNDLNPRLFCDCSVGMYKLQKKIFLFLYGIMPGVAFTIFSLSAQNMQRVVIAFFLYTTTAESEVNVAFLRNFMKYLKFKYLIILKC